MSGEEKVVCKKFFLGTLGYCATSQMVYTAKADPGAVFASPDQRGKKRSLTNPLHDQIDAHIMSHHPSISHYRREHAPNRLYLPHELTVKAMHDDYKTKHSPSKGDYTTYLRRVNKLNISFAQLGEEECEVCLKFKEDKHGDGVPCGPNCSPCAENAKHLTLAGEARDAYKNDGKVVLENTMVRSVDLQKVIMLPRLPGVKSACFTRRLVAFHHTFAPVASYTSREKPVSILWHEAVSGRKCEDIASAAVLAMEQDRDMDHLIYYMDNCAGQNKNYTFFTTLMSAVNGQYIAANTITLKYLEAGHTFMSADSFHAAVERQFKTQKNVYDFDDFSRAVRLAGAVVLTPDHTSFLKLEGHQSQAKLKKESRPLLSDIRVAEFRLGSRLVYFKNRHTDTEWQEFDYIKVKHNLSRPGGNETPRGVPAPKKEELLRNLVPMMPESRRVFWQELATATVNDLIDHIE